MDPVKELTAMQSALEALMPLDDDARKRAIGWLSSALGLGGQVNLGAQPLAVVDEQSDEDNFGSPREFMFDKKPKTDVERMACLGFYLTYARDLKEFNTRDLTALNQEAAGIKFTNPTRSVNNATSRNHYFAPGNRGKKQLSPIGEQVVRALPDRDAVRQALAEHQPRRRQSGPKKAKKEGQE